MTTLYSKFNRDRLPKFQTATFLIESDGAKYFKKVPLNSDARGHITNIFSNYEILKKLTSPLLDFVTADLNGHEIFFEYVTGESLEQRLLKAAIAKRKTEFFDLLKDYKEAICSLQTFRCDNYASTTSFKDIFGIDIFLEDELCFSVSNIDLTFENLISTHANNLKVIDYEWVFEFPIPVDYIIYRAVTLFFRNSGYLKDFVTIDEIWDYFRIDAHKLSIFQSLNDGITDYVYGSASQQRLLTQYIQPHPSLPEILETAKRVEVQDQMIIELTQQVAQHKDLIDHSRQKVQALEHQLTSSEHQLSELTRHLEKANSQLQLMYDSLSWKVTAPLRKLYELLRPSKATIDKPDLAVSSYGNLQNQNLQLFPFTLEHKEILFFPITNEPLVSIVIPVYNQFEHTYSCLTSILVNTNMIDYEVIIADDCSTDDTKNLSQFTQNINHIKNTKNLGFLLNCNNAAAKAKGKYIVFLNNDTNVQPEWLRHLVDLLNRAPDVGMTGSKLVYPDGRLQEAGGIIWNDANGQNYGRLDDRTKPEYNYLKEVDYISGASIMVRKELWDRLHGFDERFAPAYYEDTDLAFSIRNLGYKVVYQPKSVVVHFEGISHGTDLGSGIKSYQVRNKDFFLEKWREVLESKHFPMDTDLFLARDRSRNKKTILFIDYQVPLFDQFAGSRTNYMYLRMLLHMGFNVKFIGADFFRIEPYSTALNDLGIETLDGDWYRENWKQWILQNAQYLDYVLLNKPDPANMFLDFIKENTDAKIIYQGHDLHYLRLERKYEVEGDKKILSEAKKYKDIESSIFAKADMVFTFSAEENSIISNSFPEVNVKTVPLYFYEEFPPVSYEFGNRSSTLFVGGFAHTPNIDAISWFCKEILPLVHRAVPELVFKVIGSNPPPEIRCLASDRVQILGFVTDEQLKQHYQTSRLVVIPLRFGAGVKGKTLEAMYHGLPIVSTSIGIEGIPDISSVISPTDDAESFARRIIDLYQSPQILEDASRNNRDFIRSRYNFMSAQKCIEGIFTELGMKE
jgi:Predicted glycosyltransferases